MAPFQCHSCRLDLSHRDKHHDQPLKNNRVQPSTTMSKPLNLHHLNGKSNVMVHVQVYQLSLEFNGWPVFSQGQFIV